MPVICEVLSDDLEITSFVPMKLGMTNDSFIFEAVGTFMLRSPGAGVRR